MRGHQLSTSSRATRSSCPRLRAGCAGAPPPVDLAVGRQPAVRGARTPASVVVTGLQDHDVITVYEVDEPVLVTDAA